MKIQKIRTGGRCFALLDAIRNIDRHKKLDAIIGGIIWGLMWLIIGALIANALCGKVWR